MHSLSIGVCCLSVATFHIILRYLNQLFDYRSLVESKMHKAINNLVSKGGN